MNFRLFTPSFCTQIKKLAFLFCFALFHQKGNKIDASKRNRQKHDARNCIDHHTFGSDTLSFIISTHLFTCIQYVVCTWYKEELKSGFIECGFIFWFVVDALSPSLFIQTTWNCGEFLFYSGCLFAFVYHLSCVANSMRCMSESMCGKF